MPVEEAVTLAERIERLGIVAIIALVLVALLYAVFVARKTPTGEAKSSLLRPGWQFDELKKDHKVELDTQRRFYQKALTDAQESADARISEFRGARDVAIAEAADARADRAKLLEAVTDLSRDVAVLLEVHRMAARDGSKSGTQSG